MDNLLNDLDRAYKGLQHLQLESTKTNMAIIWDTLNVLEKVSAHLQEENNANTNNSGN